MLGQQLDDVKVHRGPDVGEAAQAIDAKAFTTGGEVFMPDWHGSTSSGEGRDILRHELTHVAQQRTLGTDLPGEDTPAGRALEAEARSVGGQGPATSSPVSTRPVAARHVTASRRPSAGPAQRLAGVAPPDPVRRLSPPAVASPAPSVAAPVAESSAAQLAIVAQVQAAAAGAGVPAHRSGTAPAGPPVSAVAGAGASGAPGAPDVQRLPDAGATAGPTVSSAATPPPAQPSPDAGRDLDELARRLYPKFRTRLRHDLLADRERSGRLFDTR